MKAFYPPHFIFLIPLVFLLTFLSCHQKPEPQKKAAAPVIETAVSFDISLDADRIDSGAIEIASLTLQPFQTMVKAIGTLAVPPQNQIDLSVFFEGTLTDIDLLPGTKVSKGETLFTISGPAYIDLQEKFIQSRLAMRKLKVNFDRQKELFAEQLISEKEFLETQSQYEIEKIKYQAFVGKLALLPIRPDELTAETIQTAVKIKAPISGFVTSIAEKKGAFLNPEDVVLTLTNTDALHLEIKIFENDYPKIAADQELYFWLQNSPEKKYKGSVHLVNKSLNEEDRSIEIHGDIEDKGIVKSLAPGMYIECEIITDQKEFAALPTDAIVNIDEQYYVLQQTQELQFKKVEVKVGQRSDRYTQILNSGDFDADTKFIVKGAFNLISE